MVSTNQNTLEKSTKLCAEFAIKLLVLRQSRNV